MAKLCVPIAAVWLVAFAFTFVGCTPEHGEQPKPISIDEVEGPVAWGAAKNVVRLRHLWFSDQPDEEALTAANRAGVTRIIDLRAPEEREWDESAVAERLGLAYRNVVIPAKGPFDAAAFEEIEAILKAHPGEPTLIHCSSGNRAAAWLATHLVKTHDMPFADALAIGRRAGITKTAIEEKVASYLGEDPPAVSPTPRDSPSAEKLLEQARQLFGTLPAGALSDTNAITQAKVELGRMLYYEDRLSRNHDVSCNTCHPLADYGVDHEPTSPGHLGARGQRNSPTVYNAAFHIAQFWDGRAADVEEQARGPIQNPVEMAMPNGDSVVRVLRSIPGYAPLFREVFPEGEEPITFDNTVLAIGAFERKLITPSRFDDFLKGDTTALSAAELDGLSAFIDTGCTACHSGALLGGHMYQKLGLVNPYETEDLGRYLVTKSESDRSLFKVPSLRNIAETGPYLHDGSIHELGEVVGLMAWHQIGRKLTESDTQPIVTFLESLTGRIDQDYIARPALPESGPDTPKPDPSDPFERPPRFAPAPPRPAGSDPVSEQDAAALVDQRCRSCHRFEGEPESKFNIAGPDLMWGGQKYKRAWLVGWLQGLEPSMYPETYRWDQDGQPPLHPAVLAEEAEAIADYFEKRFVDPRVPEGAYDLTKLTEFEAQRGGELFREYSCIGCHQVLENGKTVGGPISTTFFDAAGRYDADWVWAFNLAPQNFTPHSGEYVADLSDRKVRWLTGYMMTQGAEGFEFAQPWSEEPFDSADVERGAEVYGVYCAQCHGSSGEGDGPGAAGLDPQPAAHARMAIHQLPLDYLHNVVFYGGKSVGKSALMPDWGMTLTPQQIGDVVAYMRKTFRAEAAAGVAGGVCPQPRTTQQAPNEFLARSNPLEPTVENLDAAKVLFKEKAVPMACQFCHGAAGDGLGPMAAGFTPRPRNFACDETMESLSDGQLFWIIQNGSPGTGMMAYSTLSEEQIWQLVLYVREIGR